ncbi:MAG TPA: 3-phosphoshikimate 1-carboxyvinyltransferase [Bacteroidota bacterium]
MIQKIIVPKGLHGTVTVPGDKSISHRALMISALADGACEVTGLSGAADPVSTKTCLQSLGVEITERKNVTTVYGKGLHGLQAPKETLDAGNSGTTLRLLTGILSGQRFSSEMTGDESLRKRPMKRVMEPLQSMGADIRGTAEFTAPLRVNPVQKLKPISYDMPLASAQVKSAILLAGLYAEGITTVIESTPTRDHTERMLGLRVVERGGKQVAEVRGGMNITPCSFIVPGDISAAAFFVAAGMLVPNAEIRIQNVGLNPTRTAVLDVFRQMGGKIQVENRREISGEPIGDIVARTSELRSGFELKGGRVAAVIDEIPVIAVVAACSTGVFSVRDAKELRAKESDRIASIVSNLRALGLGVEEYDDGFAFESTGNLHGSRLQSYDDHRVAMAFAVAGLRASGETEIGDAECVDISFPGFWNELRKLSA